MLLVDENCIQTRSKRITKERYCLRDLGTDGSHIKLCDKEIWAKFSLLKVGFSG
jgi:hypothetical protein